MTPKTMFEKIWDAHIVHEIPGETTILYIDTHLVHEITSAQAFEGLRLTGRKVRRPDLTFATMDHNVPTTDRTLPILDEIARNRWRYYRRIAPKLASPYMTCIAPIRGSFM